MLSPLPNQSGAALFLSLIFLLVLTIFGLASMNDSVLQTKMASAVQDSNLALQGAELAVRDAEKHIETTITLANLSTHFTDGGSGGLYSESSSTLPEMFKPDTWASSDTKTKPGTKTEGLNEAPRYYVQHLGVIKKPNETVDMSKNNYGKNSINRPVHGFRIVSRSTGGSGNSQRLIETFYGKSL